MKRPGELLSDAYDEVSGILGTMALCLEKKKMPSRASLHEWEEKMKRTVKLLQRIQGVKK